MIDYLIKMAFGGGLAGVILLIFCLIKKYRGKKLVYIVIFAVYIGALLAFTLWRTPTPGLFGKFNLVPFADLIRNLSRGYYYHALQPL